VLVNGRVSWLIDKDSADLDMLASTNSKAVTEGDSAQNLLELRHPGGSISLHDDTTYTS
jgi:hypothetical protein